MVQVLMKVTVSNADHCYAGSCVSGEVFVKTDKPKKCKSIVISLLGSSHVRWQEVEQIGNVIRTTTYTNGATYINSEVELWTKDDHPTGELAVGEHHLPFQFQLPQNCPPSFGGTFGQVRYVFEVKLTPDKFVLKKLFGVVTVKSRLLVGARADILQLYRTPETIDTVKMVGFSWMNFGSIQITVAVPYTGFSAGQSIPISANINNQSARRLRMRAALERQDTVFSSGHQKAVKSRLAKVRGPEVPARETRSFENIRLDIPYGIYPTIKANACPFISVEYVLVVKVKIPWSINRTVRIPVVIANEVLENEVPEKA